MRRWFWYILVPSVLLAGFVVGPAFITCGRSSLNVRKDHSHGLPARLPLEEKLAKRELSRARAALAALKPSRPYIVIDTHSNTLLLRTDKATLLKASCSTGSGGQLVDKASRRRWIFDTPRGVFKITSKLRDPWWRKPDWAFIEENESIPPDPRKRLDPEMMGEYALGFGEDYFIHGTIYERLLGVSVTHGCVRLGSEDLKRLYDAVSIGTAVYIF